jgi:hypothetical protein
LLSSDGISLFVEDVPFDFATETIWPQVILRLKGDLDAKDRNRRCRTVTLVTPSIPFTSTIFSEFPSILSEFANRRWVL